ncbi:PREDICTED: nucleoporin Nup37 [Ceratosolen solmsi marchali]|uniref:Nucleoporin Nup37 n=1 Tax=Ceratosolen solmsi marchali TaxID=326594 RepID=A0AAJ6YJX5_9HYME|nr:PREDICTED: nucleoporin Nup37 [Ceratosolen solmsi marchali]XP_011499459.1 PREDICTED: nucleoporin Nup37 [Ceratosolen solmsi marchali]
MEEALLTPPTFKLNFPKQVQCVEWSPYEWSQNLICIALGQEIFIATIKFQEEDDVVEDIIYNLLRTFHHETRVHAIAWSPKTSLSIVPKILSFCIAGADFKIRLYNSDLNESHEFEVLEGHKDYVNDISFDPEGKYLASVSDDHTCKLWAINENKKCFLMFPLTSAGVNVCWHAEEEGKLLVAEKNGIIHMYNVTSERAIMSVDAGTIPLSTADWGLNPLKVACIASGELITWDMSRPSRPLETRTLHIEGGTIMKFSPSNENLVASIGRPDNILKITNLKTKPSVLCGRVQLFGGLSWHQRIQIVCAGSDRQLLFWKVNNK